LKPNAGGRQRSAHRRLAAAQLRPGVALLGLAPGPPRSHCLPASWARSVSEKAGSCGGGRAGGAVAGGEGVRRFFRLQGRAAGTVAQPAATIEPALWLRFFKQAWTAKRFALIDRSLGADDAMKLGILHTQPKPKALVAPVRRDRGIAVEDVLPQLRSLVMRCALIMDVAAGRAYSAALRMIAWVWCRD
jgi:hypothetical protein